MHKAGRPAHTRIAENPQSFKRRRHHYGKEAVRDITHYIDINGKKLVNLQEWRKI